MAIRVIFSDRFERERELAVVETKEQANKVIMDFLDKYNYKSYYWRRWVEEDDREWIDVGSHSEFFILEDC